MNKLSGYQNKWSDTRLIVFSRLMKVQIRSGIPISQGIRLIKEVLPRKLSQDLDQFVYQLEQGESITYALQMLRFPPNYISLLKIGESHGDLALAFEQCEWVYQQKYEFKYAVRNAVAYPFFLLFLIVLLFFFFTTILLPQFLQLYKTLQIDTPYATQIILDIYDWILTYHFWLFLLLIVQIAAIYFTFRDTRAQRKLKILMLHVPVLRKYLMQRYTYLFSSNISLFMNRGISLIVGMDLIAESKDVLVREASKRIKDSLYEGWSIADTLTKEKLFLPSFLEIVRFYETAGSLDSGLKQYADQLHHQMNEELKRKLKWLEPVLISMTGIFVFIIIYILFSPIFALIQSI